MEWEVADHAGGVLEVTKDCAVVAVDIPIGLSDIGARCCDGKARKRLGRAGSSVFPAPVRAVLEQTDAQTTHSVASEISRQACGKGISIQTWNIVPKIREWDTVTDHRVIEVHPEVSFREMATDIAFGSKKWASGVGQRLVALRPFVDAAAALASVPPRAGVDDALDALAAAWSARRWAAGDAEPLGGEDDKDPKTGRPMRIVV